MLIRLQKMQAMSRFNECLDDQFTPQLTSTSTIEDRDSLEEFPLQPSRQQSVELPTASISTDDLGLERSSKSDKRAKRFSLRAIALPLIRARRTTPSDEVKTNVSPFDTTKDDALLMPDSENVKTKHDKQARPIRRVSFSPSTDDLKPFPSADNSDDAKPAKRFGLSATGAKLAKGLRITRTQSFDDSISRTKGKMMQVNAAAAAKAAAADDDGTPPKQRRRRSLSISRSGIQVDFRMRGKSSSTATGKGEVSTPRISHKEAIAARHARVLERVINAGTSIELEELKAKRAKKIGTNISSSSSTNVQHYPVVAPQKIKALKKALLDHDMANGIIGELRSMEVDPETIIGAMGEMNELGGPLADGNGAAAGADADEARLALRALAQQELEKRKVGRQEKRKLRPAPLRAVCLNCTDKEAAQGGADSLKAIALEQDEIVAVAEAAEEDGVTQQTLTDQGASPTASSIQTAAVTVAEAGALGAAIKVLGDWFRPAVSSSGTTATEAAKDPLERVAQYTEEIVEDVRSGEVRETAYDAARLGAVGMQVAQPMVGLAVQGAETVLLPENKVPHSDKAAEGVALKSGSAVAAAAAEKKSDVNLLFIDGRSKARFMPGVSPISFLTSPQTTLAMVGAEQSGAFDTMAALSGAAIAASQGGVIAMQDIHPPLDRMAIFIHWWGFELTLPDASMQYLETAHSVSGAFMGFLQTMVTSGGVPELLPFVRYISSFMDMEFSAIKSQNRDRHGVVVAATWLLPFAMIPRPWDYGLPADTNSSSTTKQTPHFQRGTSQTPAPALPQLPPGALPILPVRISSTPTPTPASSSSASSSASSSSETKHRHKSSQERHFECGRDVAVAAALTESPRSKLARLPNNASSTSINNVLDSVEEMPEGSAFLSKA